jgi:hypothetical protein
MFLGLDTDNKQNRTELEQAARYQIIAAQYWRISQNIRELDRQYAVDIAASYYASARRLMGIEDENYTTLFSPEDTKAIKEELDKASQRIMTIEQPKANGLPLSYLTF